MCLYDSEKTFTFHILLGGPTDLPPHPDAKINSRSTCEVNLQLSASKFQRLNSDQISNLSSNSDRIKHKLTVK